MQFVTPLGYFRPGFDVTDAPFVRPADNPLAVTTTTTLTASAQGQLVTLTATISTLQSGWGTPTGNVTFSDSSAAGTKTLGTVALINGVATFTTPAASPLALGSHNFTAYYAGPMSSSSENLMYGLQTGVTGGTATTTNVTVAPTSAVQGQSETLTATVSSTAGTPAGNVTFWDGQTELGTVSLNGSGTATFTTPAASPLALGSHDIEAVYAGAGGMNSSSAGLVYLVSKVAAAPIVSKASYIAALTAPSTAAAPGALTPYQSFTVTNNTSSTLNITGINPILAQPQFEPFIVITDNQLNVVWDDNANLLAGSGSVPPPKTLTPTSAATLSLAAGATETFFAFFIQPEIDSKGNALQTYPDWSGPATGSFTFARGDQLEVVTQFAAPQPAIAPPVFNVQLFGGTTFDSDVAYEGYVNVDAQRQLDTVLSSQYPTLPGSSTWDPTSDINVRFPNGATYFPEIGLGDFAAQHRVGQGAKPVPSLERDNDINYER